MRSLFVTPEAFGSVDLNPTRSFEPDEFGPILNAHMSVQQMDPNGLVHLLLTRPEIISVPLDAQRVANVCFIPGHVVSGPYGPTSGVKVVVIGKMPGKEEATGRRLFVGPAGSILAGAAVHFEEEHGLQDEWSYNNWYLTNVCKFYPPNGMRLKAAWVKECKLLLDEELRICKPDWILSLGGEALSYLLGKTTAVSKFRGSVFEYTIPGTEHTCNVYVTENPAAASRSPDRIPDFRRDIHRFCSMIRGMDSVDEVEQQYVYIKDVDHLRQVVDQLIQLGCTEFAVDCEWSGAHWADYGHDPNTYLRTVQVAWGPGQAFAVLLVDEVGRQISPSVEAAADELVRLLCRPNIKIIGHFFREDMHWLEQIGVDLLDRFTFDTFYAHHLLAESENHDLKSLAAARTDLGRYDQELERWKSEHGDLVTDRTGYGNIPDSILLPYAVKDADATFRLYEEFKDKVKELTYTDPSDPEHVRYTYYDVVMAATKPIYEMEKTGLLADRERMLELLKLFEDKKEELTDLLRAKLNWPEFNPQSYPQRVEMLFGEQYTGKVDENGNPVRVRPEGAVSLYLRPIKTSGRIALTWDRAESEMAEDPTKSYNPSTDDEVLGILAVEHEEVSLLRDISIVGQILKTFLKPEGKRSRRDLIGSISPDGYVRTTLSQAAETGRMRSSSPNLQNIPKMRDKDYCRIFDDDKFPPIRSCFVAPPGYYLIEADYAKAELFVLAYLSGDAALLEALEDPERDLHAERAVHAFKLNCAPTKEAMEEAGCAHMRVAAKTINFGIPYQRSYNGIVREVKKYGVDITVEQAQAAVESFYEAYPNVYKFMEECKAAVVNPGYLVNPFGRRRRFIQDVDEQQLAAQQREACNYPIQSTVADSIYRALDNLYKLRASLCVAFLFALSVHDSIVTYVPEANVGEVANVILPVAMRDGVSLPTKFGIKHLEVEIDVMRRWEVKLDKWELEALGL